MSRPITFRFQLFVAGNTQNSTLAIANLTKLCRTQLQDQCHIEIVDVFNQPKRALAQAVFLTPTLIKLGPPPITRIVGTLSQTETVLHALGLDPVHA